MPDTKLYANSYIDPSDNQRRYFLDLEATHKDDASDPNTVLGGIKSTADNAETIAKGATRAMVFDTIAAMETWLKDDANKGKLKIGDNLYIKAVDVPDYWVSAVYETATPEGFYYNYSRLEVGTVKLSNVVTTDSDVVSSLEYVFGLLSNKSVRVSLNGFIASMTNFIRSHPALGTGLGVLFPRGNLNVNADTIIENGIYAVYGTTGLNTPTSYGIFICLRTLGGYNGLQLFFDRSGTGMYYRTANVNAVWDTNWTHI